MGPSSDRPLHPDEKLGITEHKPETFFIVTNGGPHPGTRVTDEGQMPWPLPGILGDSGGRYIKISESNLGPQGAGSRIVRSALYKWESDTPSGVVEGEAGQVA